MKHKYIFNIIAPETHYRDLESQQVRFERYCAYNSNRIAIACKNVKRILRGQLHFGYIAFFNKKYPELNGKFARKVYASFILDIFWLHFGYIA